MKGLVIRIDRLVGEAIMALACLALALAALTGLYQVVTRFLFHQPSSWSEVLTRTLVVWMVFLGLSAALRGGALLSVDLVYRLVGRTPYLGILRFAIAALTIGFLSIVLYFGIDIVHRVRFQTLAGLEISISWAYAAVPTGAAFGILATIANYLDPRRGEFDLQT
jgi:TRAP-type C4-dicarboxylate transport system permease small subunit